MKAVLQRVSRAKVTINGERSEEINNGLVVLLGVFEGDTDKEANFLSEKTVTLRIFSDENDKLNLSLQDIKGDILIISNFTLCADAKKGKRPSYTKSAAPTEAKRLYELFIENCKNAQITNVKCGEFGADMQVELVNDGPVTIILDTQEIMKQEK